MKWPIVHNSPHFPSRFAVRIRKGGKGTMAATELLDYNNIQETSSLSGDTPSDGGGMMTWNFRCDPNLAWDPSQTFFAMELEISTKTSSASSSGYTQWATQYKPDVKDFYPFFPMRAFSSMTHLVDGVTIAHTNQPYADKIMQEKYLHDLSISNQSNFESLMLARCIDDCNPKHNLFKCDTEDLNGMSYGYDAIAERDRSGNSARAIATTDTGGETVSSLHTVYFQPPFDLWTKHDRISGGNHMIQLNLKSADASTDGTYWGKYMVTPQAGYTGYMVGSTAYSIGGVGTNAGTISNANGDQFFPGGLGGGGERVDKLIANQFNAARMGDFAESLDESFIDTVDPTAALEAMTGVENAVTLYFDDTHGTTRNIRAENYAFNGSAGAGIRVKIKSLRLLRRVVRFTVERPIQMEDFACTEMAFFAGTPIALSAGSSFGEGSMTQNFLLPASTFGLAFYWRNSSNGYYDVVDDFKTINRANPWTSEVSGVDGWSTAGAYQTAVETGNSIDENRLQLSEFYFTYGGETYPSQRITSMYDGNTTMGPGSQKLQIMTHMLQGAFNTDMDRYNVTFAGRGLLDRLDGSAFFFPVAKHNNSDNSDLQVTYKTSGGVFSRSYYDQETSIDSLNVSLMVVAFYDARIEFAYNAANQLEKVTKTEWK